MREPKTHDTRTAMAYMQGTELARILNAWYLVGEDEARKEAERCGCWEWQIPLVLDELRPLVDNTYQIFGDGVLARLEFLKQ